MIGTGSTHGQNSAKTVSKSFSVTGLFNVFYARALGGSKDDKAEEMDRGCKEEATMRAKEEEGAKEVRWW